MNKKSLRLSFFNLKKNKRECFGILFMTLVTAMMLSIVLVNKEKIDTSFDESFRSSGSAEKSVAIKKDKYRNIFYIAESFSYMIEIPFKDTLDILVRKFRSDDLVLVYKEKCGVINTSRK